jgi:hypothetical protein
MIMNQDGKGGFAGAKAQLILLAVSARLKPCRFKTTLRPLENALYENNGLIVSTPSANQNNSMAGLLLSTVDPPPETARWVLVWLAIL